MGNVQSGPGPDEGLGPLILESTSGRGMATQLNLPALRRRAYQSRDPIFSTAVNQDAAAFSRLMSRSRSAASRSDAEGFMALHYASLAKWCEGVKLALKNGSDVNAVSVQGYTALMLAAAVGAADVAAALLDAGAATDARSARGAHALGIAAQHGAPSQGVLDLLIARGAGLSERGFRRRSPLETAILGHGDPAMLRSLLQAGADPSEANSFASNMTPLHLAARALNAGAIGALLAAGADVDARANQGITPAMMCFFPRVRDGLGNPGGTVGSGGAAAEARCRAAFGALVAAGADVNAVIEGRGICVLNVAMVSCAEEATINAVLDSPGLSLGAAVLGARLGRSKGTMVHLAATRGWVRTVRALAAAGAPLEGRDRDGFTPLHAAALAGRAGAVAALIAAGASPRGAGPDVFPSMHDWRAARGARAVQALVAAGPGGIADQAAAIMEGMAAEEPQAPTVDVVAEVTQDLAVLEALLAAGASPSPAALALGAQCVPILRIAVERPRWTPELHASLPPAFQAAAAALMRGVKRVSRRGGARGGGQPRFSLTDDVLAEILTAAAYPLSDWADEEWTAAQRVKQPRQVGRPSRCVGGAGEGQGLGQGAAGAAGGAAAAQVLPHFLENIVELLQQEVMAAFGPGGPAAGGGGGGPGGGGGNGPLGMGPPLGMPFPADGLGGGLFAGLPGFPFPPGAGGPGGLAIPVAAVMQGAGGPAMVPFGLPAAGAAGPAGAAAGGPGGGPPPGLFQAVMEAVMAEVMGEGGEEVDDEEEEEGEEEGAVAGPFGGPGAVMGAHIDIQIGLAPGDGEDGPPVPMGGFPLMMQFAMPFPHFAMPGMGPGAAPVPAPVPVAAVPGAAPPAPPEPGAAGEVQEEEEEEDEEEERPAKRRRLERGGGGGSGGAGGAPGPRRSARNRRH